MNKIDLIEYLDNYLEIGKFKDKSKNGLQVDTQKEDIKKIGYAVDATSYIFEKAALEGVDMVLCHHGLFWGFETVLVGVPYNRAKILLDENIGLYAAHLPLDAHREVGNNIGLLKAFVNIFGIREGDYDIEDFCEYEGNMIGYGLRLKNRIHVSSLVTPYAERLGLLKKFYNFGNKDYFDSIAFVSGGALDEVNQASREKYDIYVTGEGVHHEMTFAKELRQSVLIGGHYETEKIGPKLLAYHLKEMFGLEVVYLDEKY